MNTSDKCFNRLTDWAKKLILAGLILWLVLLLTGCAERDLRLKSTELDLQHLAVLYGHNEVVGQMAIDKLNALAPVGGANPEGYLGIVKNFSERETYNFVLTGVDQPLETKNLLLGPGMWTEYRLLPGAYVCTVYRDGRRVGQPWNFHVGPQQHEFLNKKFHWYVYMRR